MKRAKMRRLVEEVLDARRAIPERPITFDTLSIDFEERTFTIRGNKVRVDARAVDIPLLSTDRLIIPREGRVS